MNSNSRQDAWQEGNGEALGTQRNKLWLKHKEGVDSSRR